ncbi:MAG: SIR2 family protein [Clostridium sp.]|nr:SIR2 family protein [Clostridium sp.]
MEIKDIILKKIKTSPAPPFLFIGSGLSQRYLGTPTWHGLLKHFAKMINEEELAFEMYLDEASRSKNYNGLEPKIAEILEADFNKIWFKDEKFTANRKESIDLVKQGCSPMKIEIANFFQSASTREFIAGNEREIELLKQVGDRSLAGVITTNYDVLVERIFSEYKYSTLIGQEELIFSPLTGISEIYKIHGCCTNPKSIILNDKDYDKFNERNAYLVAKLLTIFLEHPIIFIGYRIGDSNIREILSSIAKCLPDYKLELLKDRFIFIEWNDSDKEDSVSNYEFSNLSDNKSISMTKIYIKDFSCLFEALLENKVKYNPRLIRMMKEDIYNVVLTSEPSKTINVLVDIEDNRLEEVEAVVGFGIMKQLGHKGYDGIEPEELFEDIIYDNKNFIPSLIIEKSLPLILKYNQSIPMYKYASKYKGKVNDKVKRYLDRSYPEILTRKMRIHINREGYLSCDIQNVIDRYGFDKTINYIKYIHPNRMNHEELLKYIKEYHTNYPDILRNKKAPESSELKRLIRIYDYLKYKKEA